VTPENRLMLIGYCVGHCACTMNHKGKDTIDTGMVDHLLETFKTDKMTDKELDLVWELSAIEMNSNLQLGMNRKMKRDEIRKQKKWGYDTP